MAIREYIGARYVPIFDGDWDITKTYEPLVIVNYQGNSYTSKKYVPSGVQITDADYWASSGNYSQQIEQLRQELSAATQDIADLQDIVTDPIEVAHGGTGSTTAADARAALEITPANIGALPATGGTINGNITLIGNEFIKSPNIESGVRPSVDTSGRGIQYRDVNDALIGVVGPKFFADGTQIMQLVAERRIGSTNYTNVISCGVDENGSMTYGIADPIAFFKLLGMSAARVGTNSSWSTSFSGSACLVAVSRGSYWALLLIDYWSATANMVAQSTGAQSAGLPTIAKSANSNSFTITNDHNVANIAVQVFSIPDITV